MSRVCRVLNLEGLAEDRRDGRGLQRRQLPMCEREQQGRLPNGSVRRGPIRNEVDKDLYRTCMRLKGYELVEGGKWEGFRD